ncbi:MAG TPA: trehalase family glycosidase [Candidatus Sulfotelmatobacter sp.]
MPESGSGACRRRRSLRIRSIGAAWIAIVSVAALGQSQGVPPPGNASLSAILTYIRNGWDSLTRSTISCGAASDPKLSAALVIYLPADFAPPPELEGMQRGCKVRLARLPHVIHQLGTTDADSIQPPGLLYLKNNYVVPGGRFNEMYGWDSYFIIRGLLRDGRVELARGMVENFFFEIEHYGGVLNANRTYYLSRSQPPFLSSMVMAVHAAQTAAGQDDRAWLETAYSYVKRDHAMWTHEPHRAGNTGLARYYDFGVGPAPEALQDENDMYRQVAAYFLFHKGIPAYEGEEADVPASRASGSAYAVLVCGSAQALSSCEPAHRIRLKADYYKGDRSMRESGFDVSFRFGPYGAATHHYAAVCLNSLLFKTEQDLEAMSRLLGKSSEAAQWRQQAENRKQAMQKYLWDEKEGLFFDYNFDTEQRSTYRYATTFYPLWAGSATAAQARAVVKNLTLFDRAGGIATSLQETQGQWDYPFGWAPVQLLAVEGMRRYGYNVEADRVSTEFLSTVLQNFMRDGTIREKYNVVTRSSETNVKAGYGVNVIGFGWTNATFVELLHSLPSEKVAEIAKTLPPPGAPH